MKNRGRLYLILKQTLLEMTRTKSPRKFIEGDLVQVDLYEFPEGKEPLFDFDDQGFIEDGVTGTVTDVAYDSPIPRIRIGIEKDRTTRYFNFHPNELVLLQAVAGTHNNIVEDATQVTDEAQNLIVNMADLKKVQDPTQIQKEFEKVEVQRRGDQIVLPEGMTYATAKHWLTKQEEAEEKIVAFNYSMKGYALDGAYAFYRALERIYGFVELQNSGFFGMKPPTMIALRLADGTIQQVPWGRLGIPAFDQACYLEMSFDPYEMKFYIVGQIRKKHEWEVNRIAHMTEKILREESIYKGQAIKVDLSFIDAGGTATDPEFLTKDVINITEDDVLMSDAAKLNYSAVLLRIEQSDSCKLHNIPLKHGCLLGGPYGTGKTMTAKLTAAKAVKNGWTYIYLENAKQLAHALRLATIYAPAVIFAEDIDKAVEGGRTEQMNNILNTLDGIDTKNTPIITILTTNHVEHINPAFLRAGRIDTLVYLGPLDDKTALKYLEKNVAGLIAPNEDLKIAAKSLNGIVPAFASEVINKAKMYAMYRTGSPEIQGKLTSDDLIKAIASLKEHIALTEGKKELSYYEKIGYLEEALSTLKRDADLGYQQVAEAAEAAKKDVDLKNVSRL